MVSQYKIPGVYVRERNAFPNSVVEVPTAVPVFIGYTEIAERHTESLVRVPTRVTSLIEYTALFGERPKTKVAAAPPPAGGAGPEFSFADNTRYLLRHAIESFYANGGGACWIVSVGLHGAPIVPGDLTDALELLVNEPEPTIVVIPDAMLVGPAEWSPIAQGALLHCSGMRSRIALLDVPYSETGIAVFREGVGGQTASGFGVAYYPWVVTSLFESSDLKLELADQSLRELLADAVANDTRRPQRPRPTDPPISNGAAAALEARIQLVEDLVGNLRNDAASSDDQKGYHQQALAISPDYAALWDRVRRFLNTMPPSGAMAGVFANIDRTQGVWRAPANVGIVGVVAPERALSEFELEDLNMPLDGIAINAIRTFLGRGVKVWGARTIDGNSQDWRYLSVRRTIIMLEQSIKIAAESYVFAPNNAATWVTVRNMIRNFLDNQWKAGALVGATPDEAYSVDVGLGSTMTGIDILDGLMKVVVKVAIVRPAEFIELLFQQKMQTS